MNKQKQGYIKWLVLSVFIICFGIATFYDLAISKAIANENNIFGKWMENTTVVPFAYTLLLSGCIALGTCKKEKSVKGIAILVLCLIYYILGVGLSGLFIWNYLGVWILALHAVGICALTVFAFKIKDKDKKNWQKVALVCGLTFLLSVIAVEVLKLIWGRVRPRALEGRDELFTRWYSINGKEFLAQVTAKEEIKSFPSGHSQWGAAAFSLSTIPLASKKLQNKNFLFWCICLGWGVLVMLGRVLVGAHFPTDAMAGFGIAFMIFMIVRRVVFGKVSHSENF